MARDIDDDEAMDDVVRMAHRFYKRGKSASSEWRAEAPKWYDLVANKQWDEDDVAKMSEQRRIPVVINRVARTVNAILGTQVNNRQETRFIPREQGDVQVNEVLTGAADWARDCCDAEDEESDMFEDVTTCGMGWTETHLDYEKNPEGMILIDRVDPFEMYWDPSARKRNLSDAKWVMRMVRYERDEFEARWPDADVDTAAMPWEDVDNDEDGDGTRGHVYPQDAYKNQQSRSGREKGSTILVAHVQWLERVPVYRIGKSAETLDAEKFKKLKPRLDLEGIPYMKQQSIRWREAFVAGGELLEEKDCPYDKGPTFKCTTYKRDRNKNSWYGLVAAMMDPQKYGNKFLSLVMDIIVKNSKGGIMAEKDAFDDQAKAEMNWAQPDAIVFMRPGALAGGKIQPKPQVSLPAGLDRLIAYFLDSVHEVTGVNLELLGMANREQAGVLETTRKQAGITIIAPLFDALRRYRKEQGRVLLHFITTYLSDGRLVRIVGQGGEQYVPLVHQPGLAEYDVVVDESPNSPNMKEKTFGALVELMPALAKIGVPMPPELLDYAPIPSSLAAKWKELIEASKAAGDPKVAQEQMKKMGQEMQALSEENKKLKDNREIEAVKLQSQTVLAQKKTEDEFALAQQKIENEFRLAQQKLVLERQKAEAELQLERERANAELMLDREKAEADLTLQGEKTSAEMEMGHRKFETETKFKTDAIRAERAAKEGDDIGDDGQVKKKRKRATIERDAKGDMIGAMIEDE